MSLRFAALAVFVVVAACTPDTVASYDLTQVGTRAGFFDFPMPADERLDVNGHPDWSGFPNPNGLAVLDGLKLSVSQRSGWPVLPVAYFRWSAPLAPRSLDDGVLPAQPSTNLLLIDVDEGSPEHNRLYPLMAQFGVADDYTPKNVLALTARPGIVLRPKHRYAFVVLRALGDASGRRLGQAPYVAQRLAGHPAGVTPTRFDANFSALASALAAIGVASDEIAAATVFTTGDVVAELADLSSQLVAKYRVTVDGLHVDPDDGATHDRYCELIGSVTYPQFQHGVPPYQSEGLFDSDDAGLPSKQRDEVAPVTLFSLPLGEMPAGGFPLVVYFHGSGGTSASVVDRGPVLMAGGDFTKGQGPAYVLAAHGIAAAGSALPVNPERLPGATDTAYLNINNLAAFRDTFRQGAIEQRMFIEALRTLRVAPAATAACATLTLPAGETEFHFNADQLLAQGQSMGGMYTNLVSSIEPRIRAAVPTGAGGYWAYFILQTQLIANADGLLGAIFGTNPPTFVHPYLHLFEAASEPAEPMVYMPRLGKRPLPNHPARPVYDPVGLGDSYFPSTVYDAVALAYGHKQAGDEVWPTMQPALALDARDGIVPYPVRDDITSENGDAYTGAIVQYMGDGFFDPHAIYTQLDAVKYQYGCFFRTFLATGHATIPAVAPLGTPCPQ